MNAGRTGAVVVNLDGGEMLDACLDALALEAPASLIVVDNGSSAAEVAHLRARSGIVLVALGANAGFAGPSNRGEAALADGIPYVAFVNNDCVLAPGYLAACAAALEADPGLAAVQGVVLTEDGARVDGCGITWNARGEAVPVRHGQLPPSEFDAPFGVAGVSGTAPVFRRSVFREAGGFEESFFAYYEDVDLSLRLLRAGHRFACVPAARALHKGSATGRRRPEARWQRLLGNRARTLRRNLVSAARGEASAIASFRSAAREIGPLAAALALARALSENLASAERDRAVLAAHPPLAQLPR